MRRRGALGSIAAGLAALALTVTAASPAAAIRYGEPDAGEHPYVVMVHARRRRST